MPVWDPKLDSTPSDQLNIALQPHLPSFSKHELPLPSDYNTSKIQSSTDSGAEACIIPSSTFKEFNLPIFDVDEESANIVGAGHESYDIVGGTFLTITHPEQPSLHKSSSQLFLVSNAASQTLLSLDACKELGFVEQNFPKFALLEVEIIKKSAKHNENHFQIVFIRRWRMQRGWRQRR